MNTNIRWINRVPQRSILTSQEAGFEWQGHKVWFGELRIARSWRSSFRSKGSHKRLQSLETTKANHKTENKPDKITRGLLPGRGSGPLPAFVVAFRVLWSGLEDQRGLYSLPQGPQVSFTKKKTELQVFILMSKQLLRPLDLLDWLNHIQKVKESRNRRHETRFNSITHIGCLHHFL